MDILARGSVVIRRALNIGICDIGRGGEGGKRGRGIGEREREIMRTGNPSLRWLIGVLRESGRRDNGDKECERPQFEHRKGTGSENSLSFFLWGTEGEGLKPGVERVIETVSPPFLKGIGTSAKQDGLWVQEGRGGHTRLQAWELTFKHGTMSLALGARIVLSMTCTNLFWDR